MHFQIFSLLIQLIGGINIFLNQDCSKSLSKILVIETLSSHVMAACTAKLSILSLCLSQATTLICLADWGSSVGRCIVKRMSLKVKELQVIRSLIPLVLIIVISWTRHTSLFLVHLESLLNSEEKIIAESLSILTVCALFVHVGAGTNVFGCCRIKILTIKKIFILTWISCDWKSW